MFSGNSLKKGVLIDVEGTPYRVVEVTHHAMGRGGGVLNTKLKNLVTGSVLERTFRPTDKIPTAKIDRRPVQYLYREGNSLVLMDTKTYEQDSVELDVLGDQVRFLPEGGELNLLLFAGQVIGAEIPNNLLLKISHTEPGLKGDTATAASKPATLETGVQVNVPLFINSGDVIKVDTRTGQYLERAK